jgi:hypothetical protein
MKTSFKRILSSLFRPRVSRRKQAYKEAIENGKLTDEEFRRLDRLETQTTWICSDCKRRRKAAESLPEWSRDTEQPVKEIEVKPNSESSTHE